MELSNLQPAEGSKDYGTTEYLRFVAEKVGDTSPRPF